MEYPTLPNDLSSLKNEIKSHPDFRRMDRGTIGKLTTAQLMPGYHDWCKALWQYLYANGPRPTEELLYRK